MDTREWSVEIGEDSVAESSGVECGVECGQKREVNCGEWKVELTVEWSVGSGVGSEVFSPWVP